MFRKLVVSDAEIDSVLNKAYDRLYEPGLTDDEVSFHLGVIEGIEWLIDEDAKEPVFAEG